MVHVMSLALSVGTAAMLDLRLVGLTLREVRVSELVARLLPWTVAGFLLMFVSGALLFSADPVNYYGNIIFRTKMAILAVAVVNAWVFHALVYRSVAAWDASPVPPTVVRIAGGVSLLLWGALIMAGRMVYYNEYWFE